MVQIKSVSMYRDEIEQNVFGDLKAAMTVDGSIQEIKELMDKCGMVLISTTTTMSIGVYSLGFKPAEDTK